MSAAQSEGTQLPSSEEGGVLRVPGQARATAAQAAATAAQAAASAAQAAAAVAQMRRRERRRGELAAGRHAGERPRGSVLAPGRRAGDGALVASELAPGRRAADRPAPSGERPAPNGDLPAPNGERLAPSGDRPAPSDPRLTHERRRIAADVHDLVMQDVSFALATARAIADDPALAAQYAAAAVAAGERALAGARSIVSDLAGRDRRPPVALVRESVLLAAREVPLTLEMLAPADSFADAQTSDALVHIAREAVTNAVKHARAGTIHVTLARPDEWRLRVRDDGRGFDPSAARRGFGLDSARRHAEELGGRLRLVSAPGRGTILEVSLP